jgi:hypothetical protein
MNNKGELLITSGSPSFTYDTKKYVGLEVVEVIMFLYLSMYTLAYTCTRYNENTGSRDSQ